MEHPANGVFLLKASPATLLACQRTLVDKPELHTFTVRV